MFRSIRWRLILSYVLLTLLVVTMVGMLSIAMVNNYLRARTEESLTVQAEQISRQAQHYFAPFRQTLPLRNLAFSAAFVGDFRVQILDADREIVADSGAQEAGSEIVYFWSQSVVSPAGAMSVSIGEEAEEGTSPANQAARLLRQFAASTAPLVIRKHWERRDSLGPTFVIEQYSELRQTDPRSDDQAAEQPRVYRRVSIEARFNPLRLFGGRDDRAEVETDRQSLTVTVPVGSSQDPLGYVALTSDRGLLAAATLATRRAFLFSAIGATLIAVAFGFFMGRGMTTGLVELTATVAQMESGDLTARVSTRGKDEVGRLSRQFNRMAQQLEAQFTEIATERDALRLFVADASHELRTPLTALKTFNDLLQNAAKDDPVARREFLMDSQHQLDRLEWITHNLLNLSRLDAGLVELSHEKCDAQAILERSARAFYAAASEKSLTMEIVPPKRAFEITCDLSRLEIALSNLVSNAVKFTPSGGSITIGAQTDRDGGRAYLWVSDTGCGIREQDQKRIFDRFFRCTTATGSGSGLGLAIAQRVVELHNGRITVASTEGNGATFTIDLPLAP